MKNKEEIFSLLCQLLEQMFEVDPTRIETETTFRELDIDSIDAVDLMVRLHELTGKRIAPEDFKSIVTVGDVVEIIWRMVSE